MAEEEKNDKIIKPKPEGEGDASGSGSGLFVPHGKRLIKKKIKKMVKMPARKMASPVASAVASAVKSVTVRKVPAKPVDLSQVGKNQPKVNNEFRPDVKKITEEVIEKDEGSYIHNEVALMVVRAIKNGEKNFAGRDFTGQNFREADLRKADFKDTIFTGADLRKATLGEASFNNVSFKDADLRGVDLRNANLTGVDLSGADLRGANLQGANLKGVKLKGAMIEGANFTNTTLDDDAKDELQRLLESMEEVDLTKFDLKKIDLSKLDLRKYDLTGVDFTGIDLRGVNLVGVNLSGAKIDTSYMSKDSADHLMVQMNKQAKRMIREENATVAAEERAIQSELDEIDMLKEQQDFMNMKSMTPEHNVSLDPQQKDNSQMPAMPQKGAELSSTQRDLQFLKDIRKKEVEIQEELPKNIPGLDRKTPLTKVVDRPIAKVADADYVAKETDFPKLFAETKFFEPREDGKLPPREKKAPEQPAVQHKQEAEEVGNRVQNVADKENVSRSTITEKPHNVSVNEAEQSRGTVDKAPREDNSQQAEAPALRKISSSKPNVNVNVNTNNRK